MPETIFIKNAQRCRFVGVYGGGGLSQVARELNDVHRSLPKTGFASPHPTF